MKSFTSKLYLILCLGWISISQTSCLIDYYSPDVTLSFTGTTSYCQGSAATANTLNYDQCSLGLGLIPSGVAYTAQWYYNTTGGTSIPGSIALGGPISGTSAAGGPDVITYTPLTTTVGTFYYFCYISWSVAGTCTTDYTSSTQTINITAPAAAITGTASMCLGSNTTLGATPAGGVWSSGSPGVATVVAGVVSSVSAGTAVISYALGGCVSTRIVTVNGAPAAIGPATPVTVCQSASTTLTNATAGGTWTSSAPGTASVTSGGIVTGVAGGTATITYTLTATGCYSTKNVTVMPTPLPITGVTQVCPLGTTLLSDPSPGGVWSSATPATATINPSSGLVTGVAAGTVVISYTGCGSVTTTVSVHPAPAPITGPLFVCAGGSTITMSSLTLGGMWSSGSPANATAVTSGPGTGLITGMALGTADITYTSTLGCVTSAQITVTPLPGAIVGSVPVCVGQIMALTNSVPGGYWVSATPGIASVAPSGVVTGISGGMTAISYVTGCGLATVMVTINSTPLPIVGNDNTCVGSTTVFASATIGGTWSSSTPSVATTLTGSGIITGVSTGMSIITYTMPGGCLTSKPINVLLAPPAITGSMQVCPGNMITLSGGVAGGTWTSSSGAATVNLTTGVVTGVTPDTALITFTTPAGCISQATVTVNPLPMPIVGETVLCATQITTLFNPTPGGSWSSITPTVATVDAVTGEVTTLMGGTATIRYTLPTGCYVSKSFTVKPIPGPIVTYVSEINTFYTDPGFVTYQWYDSVQGAIPGATTNHTAALYFGQYWVVVTDATGCPATSAKHPYNKFVGLSQPAATSGFRVYPNPTSELVNIESPVKVRAVVSGIDGKSLIDKDNAKEIDISQLADGMYLVSLFDDTGRLLSVHKLVKQ